MSKKYQTVDFDVTLQVLKEYMDWCDKQYPTKAEAEQAKASLYEFWKWLNAKVNWIIHESTTKQRKGTS